MSLSIEKALLLLLVNCCLLISCNQELINKWTKIDNRFYDITLDQKGKNGVGGNYLIPSSPSRALSNKYSLKTSKGQIYTLPLEDKAHEYRILYFEFTENSLFVIINSYAPRDWISFKSFDLATGKLILSDGGEIPCQKKYTREYDWNLGNRHCDWIDIPSKQITYARTSPVVRAINGDSLEVPLLEWKILSYNWLDHRIDTVVQSFFPGIDAITGGMLGLKNTYYKQETGKFEYPKAH